VRWYRDSPMRHTYGAALLALTLAPPTARAQDTRALVIYIDSVSVALSPP